MPDNDDNAISVYVWLVEVDMIHLRPASYMTTRDTTVGQLRRQVAEDRKYDIVDLQLWKPHELLMKDDRAGRKLTSLLTESNLDLNEFCDELSSDDDTLHTVLGARGQRGAALVAHKSVRVLTRPVADRAEQAEDTVTELVQNLERALIVRSRPSPSVAAQPPRYLQYQDDQVPILDGRYGQNGPHPLASPVEIFCPAFAAFAVNAKDESLEVPEDLVRSTAEFMVTVSQIATSESQRSTRDDLSNLLSSAIIQAPNRNRTAADHVILHSRTAAPYVAAAIAIVEEKGELGLSGEPSVQGSFSFIEFWTDKSRASLLAECFCPTFVLAIAGPWLTICGAIFTTHPIVHRLTDYIWLGHSRAIDDQRAISLARVFYSLRLSIDRLRTYYDTLDISGDKIRRFFPLATSFSTNEGSERLRFRYLQPLKGASPSCTTFLVETCEAAPRRLVVKFVERYGEAAHRLLAKEHLAPELLYCGSVWPTDEVPGGGPPGHKMVVMEHIEGETAYEKYPPEDGQVPGPVRERVLEALDILHRQQLVHGDVRLPNFMIVTDVGDTDAELRRGMKVIDFDWAGIEGQARYPLHLTTGVWVEGVESYGLIRAKHDLDMANRL